MNTLDPSPPSDPAVLQALGQISGSALANAIERFGQRLRNEGFVRHGVHSLFPELPPVVGYAATLRIRGSAPPTAARPYTERTDWWDYVLTLPAPRILVIQDVASDPGLAAYVGEVHMSIAQKLGCRGVVTNGAVRDLPALRRAGFACFAGGVSVSHGYVHVLDCGQPVEIGGLTIRSADLLHADLHGVQTVPAAIAARIPEVAARMRAFEQQIVDLCRSPTVTLEQLRELLGHAPREP